MHKDHPEFWKSYLGKFAHKTNRFVVISAVSTGTSPSNDVLLSLGAVAVEHNAINVKESIEMVFCPYIFAHPLMLGIMAALSPSLVSSSMQPINVLPI